MFVDLPKIVPRSEKVQLQTDFLSLTISICKSNVSVRFSSKRLNQFRSGATNIDFSTGAGFFTSCIGLKKCEYRQE